MYGKTKEGETAAKKKEENNREERRNRTSRETLINILAIPYFRLRPICVRLVRVTRLFRAIIPLTRHSTCKSEKKTLDVRHNSRSFSRFINYSSCAHCLP